ncbi:50S ribosomal protein L24 [Christensenella timonensis]|uniref:50S ribosomal protein L24 n=1 Tax=Christensenella timonensis TaxID=1816678 RepID=UPI00082F54C1|nr:50S ribosomal protein L24 [Christensenella timonensis]
MNTLNIKKGDTAVVISGKEKGKEAKVLRVIPDKNRVILEKVNMLTKHKKPKNQTTPGGIIKQEGPIDASNVMVVCPKCSKATRVGHEIKNGEKVRVCKKCGAQL